MSGDRPLCRDCGKSKAKKKDVRNGRQRYKTRCSGCEKRAQGKTEPRNPVCPIKRAAARRRENRKREIKRKPWLLHRKNHCERCGFVPEHLCQLDVDHIDGNRHNNDPTNYQTLCANCHRLKTQVNQDWRGCAMNAQPDAARRPVNGDLFRDSCNGNDFTHPLPGSGLVVAA